MTHIAKQRWLKRAVKAVFILNLLDLVLTIFWVSAGLATEANPIMWSTFDIHPLVFALAKTLLVTLGLAVLWRLRAHPWAQWGIYGACAIYVGLFFYHLWEIGARLAMHFLHR